MALASTTDDAAICPMTSRDDVTSRDEVGSSAVRSRRSWFECSQIATKLVRVQSDRDEVGPSAVRSMRERTHENQSDVAKCGSCFQRVRPRPRSHDDRPPQNLDGSLLSL